MADCVCGSDREFESCCQPLLSGERYATTPVELMRSRYVAYTMQQVDYIVNTTIPSQQSKLEVDTIQEWSKESKWLGLEIHNTQKGGADDATGSVEFTARFEAGGDEHEHHEMARFERVDGRWYFDNKRSREAGEPIIAEPKVGRNEPCPCGSGKKYKKCCGGVA